MAQSEVGHQQYTHQGTCMINIVDVYNRLTMSRVIYNVHTGWSAPTNTLPIFTTTQSSCNHHSQPLTIELEMLHYRYILIVCRLLPSTLVTTTKISLGRTLHVYVHVSLSLSMTSLHFTVVCGSRSKFSIYSRRWHHENHHGYLGSRNTQQQQ